MIKKVMRFQHFLETALIIVHLHGKSHFVPTGAPDETGAHQAATQGQDQNEATVSRAKPRHHGSLDFQGSSPGWVDLCVY